MIEGESGILAICPPWERPDYQPSKRQLAWPNGAKSLIFTADEPERLRGKQHDVAVGDEVAAWRYPEAWDQAMFGLRLGPNPQAVVTTTPKPTPLIRDLVANPNTASSRAARRTTTSANLAEAFADEIIRKYEGTRLGRQELLGELLEDEGLAYRFSERSMSSRRSRSRTRGSGSSRWTSAVEPDRLFAYAVDYDGNQIVFDGLYEPGLPSEIAPLSWSGNGAGMVGSERRTAAGCRIRRGLTRRSGTSSAPRTSSASPPRPPTSSTTGVPVARANNDRRAGFVRISERSAPPVRVRRERHRAAPRTVRSRTARGGTLARTRGRSPARRCRRSGKGRTATHTPRSGTG
jgi:hypothetical protein